MNIESILVIFIACLIGVGYLIYIQRQDIYEKEPFIILAVVSIIGGSLAVIISLTTYSFINADTNFVDSFIKVGPIEESAKLLALAISYRLYKKHFNELVDGLIYITAIALGFSVIENVFYAMRSDTPGTLLFIRSVFSTIGHIVFSGYMGIAFFIHKKIQSNYYGLLFSVIIASFMHGLFNGILITTGIGEIFKYVFLLIVFGQIWFYKIALGFSEKRKAFDSNSLLPSGNVAFLYCNHCQKSMKAPELRLWKIKAGICSSCGRLVLESGHIWLLFKYYRPIFNVKRYRKELKDKERIFYLDNNQEALFNKDRESLCSNIEKLNAWLEDENMKDRVQLLNSPFSGLFLKAIGYRHLENLRMEDYTLEDY